MDRQWEDVLRGRADVLKIFLLDAQEHPPARPDSGVPASDPGLRPSVARELVRRATAAGIPVATHVETVADMRVALDAGVSILAHLPGYQIWPDESAELRRISDADAREIARRNVTVIPTVSIVGAGATGADSARIVERRLALQREAVARLKAAGARIVIGSDYYGQTAWREVAALRELGLWSDLELLRMWSITTPQSLYPGRRFARLEPGYEASFLVLPRDPTVDLSAAREARLGVKQGCVILRADST